MAFYTPQQERVLELLFEGAELKQIAQHLGMSEPAVANIMLELENMDQDFGYDYSL